MKQFVLQICTNSSLPKIATFLGFVEPQSQDQKQKIIEKVWWLLFQVVITMGCFGQIIIKKKKIANNKNLFFIEHDKVERIKNQLGFIFDRIILA